MSKRTLKPIALAKFVQRAELTMSVKKTDSNPNMDGGESMDHWACVISNNEGDSYGLVFSQGRGHEGAEPTIDTVLDCLAGDAASVECVDTFEEWAGDLGYDVDSRKAEKTYNACCEEAEKLEQLIGKRNYQVLLFRCERL